MYACVNTSPRLAKHRKGNLILIDFIAFNTYIRMQARLIYCYRYTFTSYPSSLNLNVSHLQQSFLSS